MASGGMSSKRALIWDWRISGWIPWTASTPLVFWAVMAVMAEVPKHDRAAKVLRSAWIPAPPPESEPAMVLLKRI